jgi:tripartite-type tricarboxylate transporter receptor subunit TctC
VVPLLTSGAARAPALPSVPTAAEAGLPALSLTSWAGLAAPAGTPAPIIAALNREVNAALRSEEARALVTRMGIATVGGSAEDMAARIAREAPLYRRIITDAGVSAA